MSRKAAVRQAIMTSGGARNRSGPPKDPKSGRSDRLKVALGALPAAGYTGRVPAYPLPPHKFFHEVDGVVVEDTVSARAFRAREIALWRELWRTPQACAWALPENKWRIRVVANYCRLSVRCESPTATATLMGQLHRFADQVGMTTAGLREMGWDIAPEPEQPSSKEASTSRTAKSVASGGSKTRLKVINGGK